MAPSGRACPNWGGAARSPLSLSPPPPGKFKGCGFISFADADMAGKAVGMSGTEVLGREIKVDFAKGKSGGGGGGGGGNNCICAA